MRLCTDVFIKLMLNRRRFSVDLMFTRYSRFNDKSMNTYQCLKSVTLSTLISTSNQHFTSTVNQR